LRFFIDLSTSIWFLSLGISLIFKAHCMVALDRNSGYIGCAKGSEGLYKYEIIAEENISVE